MLNSCVFMGRIGRDPDVKQTQSGVHVCNFTIAVDRDYRNGDEKVTDWIDVVAWRGLAEFIEKYGSKGRMVVVHGSLQSRKWQDKDGNNRTSWEIQAQNVYFADSKKDGADHGGPAQSAPSGGFENLGKDDGELPFDQ